MNSIRAALSRAFDRLRRRLTPTQPMTIYTVHARPVGHSGLATPASSLDVVAPTAADARMTAIAHWDAMGRFPGWTYDRISPMLGRGEDAPLDITTTVRSMPIAQVTSMRAAIYALDAGTQGVIA
jgi:hypothetical protein